MSQLPIVGRPVTPAIPPWKKRIETSWPLCPVCIERITQMSSTMPAVSGRSSETSVPHCPCLANFQGVPNSFLLARLTKLNTTSPSYSVPFRFDNSGFGSSKSTCDGPPCMNSEIIAFALGAKCGARAFRSRGRFSPGFFTMSASASVLAQQVGQGDRTDPEGGARQKLAPGRDRVVQST